MAWRKRRTSGGAGSKREMLRLKTPSVGKLFNYLRYCGGADARKFDEARKHREKEAKRTRGGKGWK